MKLSKKVRVWLILLAVGVLSGALLKASGNHTLSCAGAFGIFLAILSCAALLLIGLVAFFGAIVRRLTLRLAFSYFLIGIVPIPLLAALLFACSYLVAHQIVATRVYGQVLTLVREDEASESDLPHIRVDERGRVTESDVPWIAIDSDASWAKSLTRPRPVLEGDRAWMALPAGDGVRLLLMSDPEKSFARRLSEATGYDVFIEAGTTANEGKGVTIEFNDGRKNKAKLRSITPVPSPAPATTSAASAAATAASSALRNKPQSNWVRDKRWIGAVYVDPAVASYGRTKSGRPVVLYVATTSPRVLFDQLFAQGIPDVGRVFWGILAVIGGLILIVYLVALGIAFTLVGTIARNVNRLTRASRAIARGDFSVRVHSRSKDQIGDLARAFDGMAASIEGLLLDTAKKERLEADIAVARTIQQKLMPPGDVELPGLSVIARFEPLAEIGGDYFDTGRTAGGKTTIAIGDVSGHGLSTGLLVAMAKAGLSTLLESEHQETALFVKLNDLIHRSTDARNYMTLALFAFDPATRVATLTNAGQIAPYRISGGAVESLSLPSFPLGISPRSDFPTRSWQLAAGDRMVFLTDGWIEALSPDGDPFGFERLEGLLKAESESSAVVLRDAIVTAVSTHAAGTAQEDDRTLVIVTVN